jgi:hypothetical protein
MKRDIATWSRWLHIYLSMFSFLVILFFAITGITLNHPEKFSSQQVVTKQDGKVDTTWVASESSIQSSKLEIVEFFRNTYGIKAAISDFRVEEDLCTISFKGPGYAADVFIDRPSGDYQLVTTASGLVAVMNDLHKGRDTSEGWKWVIDLSAVFVILVSLTGFVMIFFLKKKRVPGILLWLIGTLLFALSYWLL